MPRIKFIIVLSSIFLLITNFVYATERSPTTPDANQRYVYEIFYKSISIGKMTQQYRRQDKSVAVESLADFSFMFYSFGGIQRSVIYWDVQHQLYLNHSFTRENVGFGSANMTANFNNEFYKTKVVNNNVKAEYTNKKAPIVGFNTINLQISEGLKEGKRGFEFYMQTSDDIAHYFFQVTGKETIKTKFGDLETYRVEQTRKNDRTFIAWFAPEFNHQMVKFHYKRRVLDINGGLIEYSTDF